VKYFSTTNEGDAAARTLGLGRRAVAENRGWSRGQGLAGGGAGGGERGSRAAAHGGGGGGAAEVAHRGEAAGRAMVLPVTGEERDAGRGGGLRRAAEASFPAS
jgi:hypothetical protein